MKTYITQLKVVGNRYIKIIYYTNLSEFSIKRVCIIYYMYIYVCKTIEIKTIKIN